MSDEVEPAHFAVYHVMLRTRPKLGSLLYLKGKDLLGCAQALVISAAVCAFLCLREGLRRVGKRSPGSGTSNQSLQFYFPSFMNYCNIPKHGSY